MKINTVILMVVVTLLAPLVFSGCEQDDVIEQRTYQLVWEDNFDGDAGVLPDSANWNFDLGTNWGNRQLEYTTDRPENVSLDGEGNLAMVARRESFAGAAFTSARITTKDLFEQAYGRFEARMKLPYGPGIWPAFWLVGEDCSLLKFDNGGCCNGLEGWPQCGEIDIMELRGQEPNIIHGSVHGPGYSAGNAVTDSYSFVNKRFDTDFYLFAIEWGEDYIDFFVDDQLYQRITPDDVPGEWVYDHPHYIILNIAVGGDYVGFPTDETPFPQTMLVDYVRVYRES